MAESKKIDFGLRLCNYAQSHAPGLGTTQPNGKEPAKGSLLKFTAHRFRRMLPDANPTLLETYPSSASNKTHEFWQPDSQAFPLYSRNVIHQKTDYIHNNPVSGKWQLVLTADAYRFSSDNFYHHEVAAKLNRYR